MAMGAGLPSREQRDRGREQQADEPERNRNDWRGWRRERDGRPEQNSPGLTGDNELARYEMGLGKIGIRSCIDRNSRLSGSWAPS